ncbi:MAG TPA: GNAT family N-acetyltransferase [Aquabacterium sp.]|jgi:ribosomal protein S18 acetylase RimI-like enzyme|nr:GNAT family N-acetyltransferase [Aquabacterium sp.]HQC98402.1 GNAT family N-acetyltransferase [Aquabacterium sp.]
MEITPVAPADREALIQLAVDTELFTDEEARALLGGVLDGLASSVLAEGHAAVCCRTQVDQAPGGWCYFAPDDHAAGVWNLWWIGVSPHRHGAGVGRALLHHVEETVRAAAGRLLVIETSESDKLARARRFYTAQGYTECGRVPDFYGEGEAKVIFARRLGRA